MTGPRKKFQGKHEELPPVAQFVLSSFNRDLLLFKDYSDEFDTTYATNFEAQITAVNDVVYPKTLTKQGKLVTERIATNIERLKDLNTLTESYVNRAGRALTIAPADFGCRDLRKKLNKGDVEGVITALRTLLKNIDSNLAALTAKGLKEATRTEMAALPATLTTDNTLQNDNIQARNKLVNENIGLFDALYDTVMDVCKVGKVIHQTITNTPERMGDFTVAVLLKRVRAERRKGGGGGDVPPAGE